MLVTIDMKLLLSFSRTSRTVHNSYLCANCNHSKDRNLTQSHGLGSINVVMVVYGVMLRRGWSR
jgi:hypothetical protein